MVTVFEHEEFGKLRVIEPDGTRWFYGNDCADLFDLPHKIFPKLKGHDYFDSEIETQYGIDSKIRPKQLFINEELFRSLDKLSSDERGENVQKWISETVLNNKGADDAV